MQAVVLIPLGMIISMYLLMGAFLGFIIALQVIGATFIMFLKAIIYFRYLTGFGYIVFEIIHYYRPSSGARWFSKWCLILFVIHFLTAALTGFDYMAWSGTTFSSIFSSWR